MSERVEDYDYELPESAVAQHPPARRTDARMLVVPGDGAFDDCRITDLPDLLRPGDLLVLNDVRVRPARLTGTRPTGGRVSILVLEARGSAATALLGARRTLRAGDEVLVDGDRWRVTAVHGGGRCDVEVVEGRAVEAAMEQSGTMPLPPYIRREPDAGDVERYQTIFARQGAAVAAPTAGLHFTPELLDRVRAKGVRVASVRLDVGPGTFLPMRGETLDEHEMHEERFEIPDDTAEAIGRAERVVAVGTTVVRALESGVPSGATRLFIRPGHDFKVVDAMLTNFHQPRSTLLVLVSAFAGRERILSAYRHAIDAGYRLFSYGDAMLLT